MRRIKGAAFDIIPAFYTLPHDWLAFQAALAAHPRRLWIRKPLASSRGRGVSVLAAPEKVARSCKPCLVQHYIRRPLLIGGVKFDLRLYVAVTSFCPLRAYVYPEGLARFATAPFTAARETLKDKGVHLTNVSINKHRAGFGVASGDGAGSKWSLGALWTRLRGSGVDVGDVWRRIHDLVALTLVAVEPQMGMQVGTWAHGHACVMDARTNILIASLIELHGGVCRHGARRRRGTRASRCLALTFSWMSSCAHG